MLLDLHAVDLTSLTVYLSYTSLYISIISLVVVFIVEPSLEVIHLRLADFTFS